MAFKSANLSVLAYANNFTLWHYTSTDAEITTSGYFDRAADMLRENDLIIANIDTSGPASTAFYVVSGNDGNRVTVASYA